MTGKENPKVDRGVTMTWWFTFASLVLLQAALLGMWLPSALAVAPEERWWWAAAYVVAAVACVGASVALLGAYRRGEGPGGGALAGTRSRWVVLGLPLVVCLTGGALLWALTDSAVLGCTVVAQALCVLGWYPGTRWRVTSAVTVGLLAVAAVDAPQTSSAGGVGVATLVTYSVLLPVLSAFSLWWWDLLLTRDPDAALEQIRAARSSVDAARQGTRDLAQRFRGVPLPDELANAADLMRAAGLRVDLDASREVAEAPADVLGPVIRETTTNVLKHGGGTWARLRFARDEHWWTYQISNDRDGEGRTGDTQDPAGSGLMGVVDRVRAVSGDARVERTADLFDVVVTVPVGGQDP